MASNESKLICNNASPEVVEKSNWVMDCPNSKLIETCSEFLPIIDDLQQACPEQHAAELEYYYNRIEFYQRNISPESNLSVKFRNELRSILKYILQLCCIYDYRPSGVIYC